MSPFEIPSIEVPEQDPGSMHDSLALIEDAIEDGGITMQVDTDTQQEVPEFRQGHHLSNKFKIEISKMF